jgi:hypothetical protein
VGLSLRPLARLPSLLASQVCHQIVHKDKGFSAIGTGCALCDPGELCVLPLCATNAQQVSLRDAEWRK